MATKQEVNERRRQEAAYNLLKASGKRVKANFSEYLTGKGRNRSLINRAAKLTPVSNEKEFTNKAGATTRYATYETTLPDVDPQEALDAATDLINLRGSGFNRAQVSFFGKLNYRSNTRQNDMGWIHGVMSNKPDAVYSFTERAGLFEFVRIVRVHFAAR